MCKLVNEEITCEFQCWVNKHTRTLHPSYEKGGQWGRFVTKTSSPFQRKTFSSQHLFAKSWSAEDHGHFQQIEIQESSFGGAADWTSSLLASVIQAFPQRLLYEQVTKGYIHRHLKCNNRGTNKKKVLRKFQSLRENVSILLG